jgi:hypothetical protein
LTPTGVPLSATFKAHYSSTFASGFVREYPRICDRLAAIRTWTPLQVFIFTDSNVFSYCVKLFNYIFRAKPLYVHWSKYLRALKLHTRQPHCISVIYLCLQMIPIAIKTKSVPACQRKEVFFVILQEATVAELAYFNWFNFDVNIVAGKWVHHFIALCEY